MDRPTPTANDNGSNSKQTTPSENPPTKPPNPNKPLPKKLAALPGAEEHFVNNGEKMMLGYKRTRRPNRGRSVSSSEKTQELQEGRHSARRDPTTSNEESITVPEGNRFEPIALSLPVYQGYGSSTGNWTTSGPASQTSDPYSPETTDYFSRGGQYNAAHSGLSHPQSPHTPFRHNPDHNRQVAMYSQESHHIPGNQMGIPNQPQPYTRPVQPYHLYASTPGDNAGQVHGRPMSTDAAGVSADYYNNPVPPYYQGMSGMRPSSSGLIPQSWGAQEGNEGGPPLTFYDHQPTHPRNRDNGDYDSGI